MKIYKKSECQYKNGYVLDKKGNVLEVDERVADQLVSLDASYQMAVKVISYGKPKAVCDMSDFVPVFVEDNGAKLFDDAETPLKDEEVKRTMSILSEIRVSEMQDHKNAIAGDYAELIEFAKLDEFIASNNGTATKFKTGMLPTILDLDLDDIRKAIEAMARAEEIGFIREPY